MHTGWVGMPLEPSPSGQPQGWSGFHGLCCADGHPAWSTGWSLWLYCFVGGPSPTSSSPCERGPSSLCIGGHRPPIFLGSNFSLPRLRYGNISGAFSRNLAASVTAIIAPPTVKYQ